MADKGPGSASRTPKKRLARAKIKANGVDEATSGKGGRKGSSDAEKESSKQRLTRIGIGIFAVIMALSMTLPSLSYIFGGKNTAEEQQEAAQAEASEDAEESEDTDEETAQASGMDTVDANYQAVVVPLEDKLKDNDKDLATLLNLGNDYMAWAGEASSYATDDASAQHVGELYDKAISYFDSYLALNDSNAVKVNRALCQFYAGDTAEATAALEQLTTDASDYGPAWANLGLLYEYQGEQDKAKDAYQKAVEVDADDEYGSKSFADRRIAAMSAQQNGGDLTDGAADVTEADGTSSLADALDDSL